MLINKLLNTLTSAANLTDKQAAKFMDKSTANLRVFKSSSKDIKLGDLIKFCQGAEYTITINGHGITMNLIDFMEEVKDKNCEMNKNEDITNEK